MASLQCVLLMTKDSQTPARLAFWHPAEVWESMHEDRAGTRTQDKEGKPKVNFHPPQPMAMQGSSEQLSVQTSGEAGVASVTTKTFSYLHPKHANELAFLGASEVERMPNQSSPL